MANNHPDKPQLLSYLYHRQAYLEFRKGNSHSPLECIHTWAVTDTAVVARIQDAHKHIAEACALFSSMQTNDQSRQWCAESLAMHGTCLFRSIRPLSTKQNTLMTLYIRPDIELFGSTRGMLHNTGQVPSRSQQRCLR